MRIPTTMCHGISVQKENQLTREHFDALVHVARELEFESIDYDDLWAWREGEKQLPDRTIMFNFDHPVKSMRYEMHEVLDKYGYRGNLFINTGPMNEMYSQPLPPDDEREFATWDELGELKDLGWHIGSHTVTHPNFSKLFNDDPTGDKLHAEFEKCDATLKEKIDVDSKDFAFTGTSWSSAAEKQVMQRYRFSRLWIIGTMYQVDGEKMRYAELVGLDGEDEQDGGPPMTARYITKESNPYRLPSMDLQELIHAPETFRKYLEAALD